MRLDLRRNGRLKFFSVVLALLVWVLTTGESQKVKDLLVPLQYAGLPAGMEISAGAPDRVSVRVQAPEPILQRITEDQVDARIDLSHLQAGDQYLTLSPDRFRVAGASVLKVEPPMIPIRIVRRAEKEVPVVPRIEGKPPEGYEVVDYRVEPPSVVVVGPEDAVRDLRRATTGSIPVGTLIAPQEVLVHPVPEVAGGSRVRLKDLDQRVIVRVNVQERFLRKILREVPVRPRGGVQEARFEPRAINVTLSGPASLVNSIDRGNLMVEIDLGGLPSRDRPYRVAPKVTLTGISTEGAARLFAEPASRTLSVWIGSRASEKP